MGETHRVQYSNLVSKLLRNGGMTRFRDKLNRVLHDRLSGFRIEREYPDGRTYDASGQMDMRSLDRELRGKTPCMIDLLDGIAVLIFEDDNILLVRSADRSIVLAGLTGVTGLGKTEAGRIIDVDSRFMVTAAEISGDTTHVVDFDDSLLREIAFPIIVGPPMTITDAMVRLGTVGSNIVGLKCSREGQERVIGVKLTDSAIRAALLSLEAQTALIKHGDTPGQPNRLGQQVDTTA